MINLLPLENRIIIKKEYLCRLFVIISVFISFAIVSAIILILPLFYFLNQIELSYSNQLGIYKEGLESVSVLDTSSSVSNLNKELTILEKQKNNRELSSVIKKIVDYRNEGIILRVFSYSKSTYKEKDSRDLKIKEILKINGHSDSRNNLIIFLDVIKNDPDFSGVQSPVSNLLKISDIDFSITIELK